MSAFPIVSGSLAAESSAVRDAVPALLEPFGLTLALSFLTGLALREYYEAEEHVDYFGSVRTYTFIGMLGFGLYHVSGIVGYTIGFAALSAFLAVYYWRKSAAGRPGMIGMMTALLTYVVGPLALTAPAWFTILFVVMILFAVNAKQRIRVLATRISAREVVAAATFLTLAGVILPLLPHEVIAPFVPLTPYHVWLAVVVSTGISYASYLLQNFAFPERGLLLSGFLGGLYSSTATTLVIARRTREHPVGREIAGALTAATATMYLRMTVLVAVFDTTAALRIAPLFVALAAVTTLIAVLLSRGGASAGARPFHAAAQRNPLELHTALVFATVLVVMAMATQFALRTWPDMGLHGLAALAGVTEIEPFVVSLLQMQVPIDPARIVDALVIATGTNNLLKAAYVALLAKREAASMAAPVLLALAAVSALYVLV